MKRQRSSDDLRKDSGLSRSSSYRSGGAYHKSDGSRKGLVSSSSSASRYDRDRDRDRDREDDNRESSRKTRKRSSDYDLDGTDRRKGFDRYRDVGGGDRESKRLTVNRSESFCGSISRRVGDFPKGFRSERDRPRRESSVSSWRRFKDFEDGGRESKRGGFKEVRSPTWSRDSRDSRSSKDRRSLEKDRDSRSSKEKSSPTWSKDSGSERSKSTEVERSKSVEVAKRNEEVQVESKGGNSDSEMEEGELEPDHEKEDEPKMDVERDCEVESAKGAGSGVRSEHLNKGFESEQKGYDGSVGVEDAANETCKEEENVTSKEGFSEGNDELKDDNKLPECDLNSESVNRMGSSGDKNESLDCVVGGKGQTSEKNDVKEVETGQDNVGDKQLPLEEVHNGSRGVDLEVQIDYSEVAQKSKEVMQGNAAPAVNLESKTEILIRNIKDKGKSVAVAPDNISDTAADNLTRRESKGELAFATYEMDGPSTRGFELFTNSPVRKREKEGEPQTGKDKGRELNLEPLDLSLRLPNVLLPTGAQERNQSPDSPSNARSVHSLTNTFQSDSDAFTASISLSGSQSFFHNPSCSLTQNSLDNLEESVKSRPIFMGVDWQALSQNECQKETPFSRMIMMNGDGSSHQKKGSDYQSRAFQGKSSSHASQEQHIRSLEGSSKEPNGPERYLSSHKQSRHLADIISPSHSVGSREIVPNYNLEKDRRENTDSMYRSNSQRGQEQPHPTGGIDFVEKLLARLISEPVHLMARKFHKMTAEITSSLKESIHEMMLNDDKRGQMSAFQRLLQNRSDTTMEMLLKCHRTQLEILAALKTGLPDFLLLNSSVSSSDLAEIYLNLRCRNLNCRSLIPVYECDCKVCAQKNGFCNACMCLLCYKFDMASNTCSWVGCDVCLHWCHANCALHALYIKNGPSATGPPGSTEMQFHCVACDHPSEMFGFVKEVFQNFAKEWTVETLRRELEYVKRIFSASKDARGMKLYKIADQMLAELADNSSLPHVYSQIMSFLADGESFKLGEKSIPSGNELGKSRNGAAGPSQEPSWLQSGYNGKAIQLEKKNETRPDSMYDRNGKRHIEPDLQRSAEKEAVFDELESIVRIKEAEAKMYQARADDARRGAEGLKRIADVKNGKIEEEYNSRIANLRLAEAEQVRKQKLEELQALERAHQDYFNMKLRMESDIRDLLVKMEATKRNLAARSD